MTTHKILFAFFMTLGATILVGLPVVHSEESPPKASKGVKIEPKQLIELGPEIEGMGGRQLRMRMLTIEPGGFIGVHSHKDRPAVAYLLSGVDTVTDVSGEQKTIKAGDTTAGNKETNHWHQNNGTEPLNLLLIDIFNETKK